MALPLLAPPTDNLYKFIAITSIVLFIIGLIGPEIAHRELRLNLYQVEGLLKSAETMSPEEREKESAVFRTLRIEARKIHEQNNVELQLYTSYRLFGNILCCVSAVGTGVGFWLWYHRVQKYLDAALKTSATAPPRET